MLQNCLATYVDKPTKGNTVFTKAQQQVAAQATAQQQAAATTGTRRTLTSFANKLDD